uniref:N-acetylmuramoyl-L-alanine amidase n=1 Tax=Eubacterium plexicaudatum ASF492 TaxID=1235802 RepID=N2ARZ4_9FIRM
MHTRDMRDASEKDSMRTDHRTNKNNRKKAKQSDSLAFLRVLLLFSAALAVVLFTLILFFLLRNRKDAHSARNQERTLQEQEGKIPRPELDVELLTVNEYSRPAVALEEVKGVVIHYTANPGTDALANRNYFEGLKDSHVTKASSHFVIGMDGTIVQCIPSTEIAYASNERNKDTLSIECCIEDDTGRFNEATYKAAVHLTAWLVEHFGLETKDVIRHYDVTGKNCPKYFVEFPSAWEQFLADVQEYLKKYGVC